MAEKYLIVIPFLKIFFSVSTYKCHCCDPKYKPFIDNGNGYIITSNLKIINSPHLQKLMKFCAKFRLPSHNQVSSVVKRITYDLDLYAYKVTVSFNKPVAYFN